MLLAQPLSRHRGFCLLETFLRVVSSGTMEESLTWGGAGLLWWVMGLHWVSRNARPRGRQALVPSTSSAFFTCSKQWYVTENLLSVLAEIILSLLLPLLIPIFCTHPVQGTMKRGRHNGKVSSQQQNEDFTVCESWHVKEKSCFTYLWLCICSHTCMKYPRNVHSMTSYDKLQVLIPPFTHKFSTLCWSCWYLIMLWLAVWGGLDAQLHICAMQKYAEVTGPQSYALVVFLTCAYCSCQSAVPLAGASVPSTPETSEHRWWKSWTSLTLSPESGSHQTIQSCQRSQWKYSLSPRLSPESGAAPVSDVWDVLTRLPTTVALHSEVEWRAISWYAQVSGFLNISKLCSCTYRKKKRKKTQ